MNGGQQPSQSSPLSSQTTAEAAALENFVRLQQHQEEFLKWLEASEKKPEMDRYYYRKIR